MKYHVILYIGTAILALSGYTMFFSSETDPLQPLWILVSVCLLGYTLHKWRILSTYLWKYHDMQLMFFHFILSFSYVGAISVWAGDLFSPLLSVALVLHGATILLLTLRPIYQKMTSLAVVVFSAASLKIFFWDMVDSTMIQKMSAFLIIGIVLLSAAYLFQRLRSRLISENEAAVTDVSIK